MDICGVETLKAITSALTSLGMPTLTALRVLHCIDPLDEVSNVHVFRAWPHFPTHLGLKTLKSHTVYSRASDSPLIYTCKSHSFLLTRCARVMICSCINNSCLTDSRKCRSTCRKAQG